MALFGLRKKKEDENAREWTQLEKVQYIINDLWGEEGVKKVVFDSKQTIKVLIEEEDITRKTDLISFGLDLCEGLLANAQKNPQTKLGANCITTFIYFRHFFECVLGVDTDIMDISYLYTTFQVTKHIPEEAHPYIQTMLQIYDLIDRGIVYLYENADNITKDYFAIVARKIQSMLDKYEDDGTGWNKIEKKEASKPQMSKEQFGKTVLGWMLVVSSTNAVKEFEENGIKKLLVNQLTYLAYLLFLTRKILETRFASEDTQIIIGAASDGVFDYMSNISEEEREIARDFLGEYYPEIEIKLDEICNDIGSEQGLKQLATSFLRDCDTDVVFTNHLSMFAMFSGFIIHHTSDILNDKVILT